ncbi:MAG: thiamine-phosphate kinase [Balneolaceae bacterium]
MAEPDFQTIHDIGFSSLIQKLSNKSGFARSEVVRGIGDDASVLKPSGQDRLILTSSEIFLEGVHFDLVYTPLAHLGFKVVTAGISDILAMNANPVTLTVAIAVPNKISVGMVEQLYEGMDAACKEYQVQITGGDTTASHQILGISVHATGWGDAEKIVYRNGASEGDLLCVTGDLGGAMAGLRILLREKQAWKEMGMGDFQPELEEYRYVVQRQLMPRAPSAFPEALARCGVLPGSMMDVTKGLMNEVQVLCDENRTGCELFAPAVPIALETRRVADEMKEDVDRYAFYGGEDFELLFTLAEGDVEKLKSEFEDFAVIGKLTSRENGIFIQTGEGKQVRPDTFQ